MQSQHLQKCKVLTSEDFIYTWPPYPWVQFLREIDLNDFRSSKPKVSVQKNLEALSSGVGNILRLEIFLKWKFRAYKSVKLADFDP